VVESQPANPGASDGTWRGWFVISLVVSLGEALILGNHLRSSAPYDQMGHPVLFGVVAWLLLLTAWFSASVVRGMFQRMPYVRPVVAAACTVFSCLLVASAAFAVAAFATSGRTFAGELPWRKSIATYTAFSGWTLAWGLVAAALATVAGAAVRRLGASARRR
jgi:hypothetical protein